MVSYTVDIKEQSVKTSLYESPIFLLPVPLTRIAYWDRKESTSEHCTESPEDTMVNSIKIYKFVT